MNILIFIPELNQSQGGVRQYSVALLKILSQDYLNNYFVYHNSEDSEVLKTLDLYSNLKLVKDSDVATDFIERSFIRGKNLINSISHRIKKINYFKISTIIDKIIDKYQIEIIHCPYQFIPITNKARLIATLHDVQEIHFPEFFTAEERAYRALDFLDYLRRADRIVVSYNHVKNDLIKYFSVPSERINVILLDMDKLWFEHLMDKDVLPINQLAVPNKFILYPANTWAHKNHLGLLQAITLLKNKYDCKINLVCSGYLNNHYDILQSEIKKTDIQDQVIFLGIVDEKTLFSLYKQCLGVVVPTLYEAGSFPLMESMLLKIPVICSNVTSLPETIGDENYLFNPLDIEEMAFKIRELWNSSEFRKNSVKNSDNFSYKFKNADALKKLKSLYEQVL